MNVQLMENCLQQCVAESRRFLAPTGDGEKVRVLPFVIDEVYVKLACTGWEVLVMGEPGVIEGWSATMFGHAFCSLLAEYFGEGNSIELKDWTYRAHCGLEAVSPEGYVKHKRVTPNIFRKYIRTDTEVNPEVFV
jgi:hypothetical protein